MRTKRFLVGMAAGAVILLAASRGGAAPSVVVVEIMPGPLDPERVRAAIGRELATTAVAPDDPRANAATGRLTIAARPSDKTLTVTFRSADRQTPVVRTVGLPEGSTRAENSAVILAGNVARDEAGDVLRGMKKKAAAPRAAPPLPQQVAALAQLNEEVSAYEKGAKDYRDTVTTIIKLHYESKKKEILSGLQREIGIEKAELKKARAVAIQRLEEFIATHTGPSAGVEAPDAMYRLAALYEERARDEDASVPTEEGLKDAVLLYQRLLREYPGYRELAGVHYFLGHALNDAGRLPESQQVWRSLVCHNHFTYPNAQPMPQDADEAYWTAWRGRYDAPRSISRTNPETVYTEVYPADCAPIAQPARRPGEDPKYVPEIWWQIGNWEFDQLDFASGVTKREPAAVWGYNRAASAYTHALGYRSPQIFGVALYKYAWTLFKQQRYELATKALVKLLVHTDEHEKRTGDRGTDFRSEAYTYIAGSLTNLDFKGPAEWEPYVRRPDILDAEPNRAVAEKKLKVAIERVSDPTLIPQDKPWTIEIYRALALEYRALDHLGSAIEVYETMLRRWPMDPTAPATQNAIAETYDQTTSAARPQKALEARTRLASYVGNTPWVDANKDNPAAIHEAERIARGGLRQAAVQHTNHARAAFAAAGATNDPARQIELLARAGTDYRLAVSAWQGYLADDDAPDAYESRYWNADARRNAVRIQAKLHEVAPKNHAAPTAEAIEDAIAAATLVRDSNQDDRYLDNAAFFVVELTDVKRDAAGLPKRDEVKFDGPDPSTRNVVRDPIPAVVQESMTARDEYARAVPERLDTQHRAVTYQYWVAETYFLYGHWELARGRFEAMWKEHCGVDAYGFKAWEKLVTMATSQRDEARALQLAEAVDPSKGNRSCNAQGEGRYTGPIRIEVAMSTARAHERAGESVKAIALYRTVIEEYGATGDLDPERVRVVGTAYAALAKTYAASFDYSKAAATYESLSVDERFEESMRREAARNAVVLYANLGERDRLLATHKTLGRLHPAAEDQAYADYRVAAFEGKQAPLVQYFQANRSNVGARRFVIEAAYLVAKMKRAGGEGDYRAWLRNTVSAWDDLAAKSRAEAQKPPYVDYAAEASFTLLDEEITAKLDAPEHHKYPGRAADVFAKYKRDAAEAQIWDRRLETDVIAKYESLEWVPAAFARRGLVFDKLRTGLYDTVRVRTLDAKGEQLVVALRSSGQPALLEQADRLEDAAEKVWRDKKQLELDGADEVMVRRYATAIAYARQYNVRSAAVTKALARLAYYTDVLGDAKMASYVTRAPDPATKGTTTLSYGPRMYVQTRPGLPTLPASP